jgi:protein FRA10AC1
MNLEDHQALLRLAGHGSSAMKPRPPIVTDYDVLKRHFRFTWRKGEDDDVTTWGARMAKRYFDKLHKEFVLADLSRWKEGKVGLRWRVEREVGLNAMGQGRCEARLRPGRGLGEVLRSAPYTPYF